MTQQDKDLLLRDLCARLPYGVKVQVFIKKDDETSKETLPLNGFNGESEYTLWIHNSKELAKYGCCGRGFRVDEVKPYLRPMSSMTDEEKEEIEEITQGCFHVTNGYSIVSVEWRDAAVFTSHYDAMRIIDWLNSHHFDFRGLIEMGLAIAVTEENNPY